MVNIRRVLGAAAAAALTASATLVSGQAADAAPAPACVATPAAFATTLAHLASPSTPGWIASDGFYPVRLDDHRTLIIAQDTFWGTSNVNQMLSGSMRHNSTLLFDDRNPSCFTVTAGSNDGGSFPLGTNPATAWYWPGQPAALGTTITMPMAAMGMGDNPAAGSWNFAQKYTVLRTFTLNGSTLTPSTTRTFGPTTAEPAGRQLAWVADKAIGDWVYMTGTDLRPGQWGHDVYLARVPVADWFNRTTAPVTSTQFLTPGGWKAGATYPELRRIIDGAGDAEVSIEHTGNEFHLIVKAYSILGSKVIDYHAATPEGAYTATTIADVPDAPGTIGYHAVVQPWGAAGLTRKVTVNRNNGEDLGWGNLFVMDRYRPTLHDVILPETVRVHTGLPAGSLAAGTVTSVGGAYAGHTKAFTCGTTPPGVSVNNFTPAGAAAGFTVTAVDASGDICISSPAPAHFIYDLVGTSTAGGTSTRLLDTRTAGPRPAAGTVTRVHTPAADGQSVMANITAVNPSSAGHLRTWACDLPMPATSMSNFASGRTTASFTAVEAGASGDLCVYTSAATDLLVDFAGTTTTLDTWASERKLDTRQ